MNETTIVCPKCKNKIPLTESLAAPLVESMRKKYEQQLAVQDGEISRREALVRKHEASIKSAQASIDKIVATKLREQRAEIVTAEAAKARRAIESDLSTKDSMIRDLGHSVKELNGKLKLSQGAEVEFRRKERELNEKLREVDLAVEKRVTESLVSVEAKARQRADEEHRLKMAEKDKLIADTQRQVEEMKRKMEQGSQQLQGEVQELELESLLRSKFVHDTIEPVPKGDHGGDVLQRVLGPLGQHCGTIIWESKRTRNWSDGWLAKLRGDQRAANAEIAVLVSTVLPKEIITCDQIEGVWVTSPRAAVAVAQILRHSLIEIAAARKAGEGQQSKVELVYQYLTGSQFRHRIQAIVEKFSDMQEDLDRERKTMTRLWAKREAQIRGVIESTAGMYGDLQGIAGKSIQEIEGLTMKSLPAPPGIESPEQEPNTSGE